MTKKRDDKNCEIPDHASMATYLVHGKPMNPNWDFGHHIIPPMSASVTYRLDSTDRGASGFMDFASAEAHYKEPIFIYDRLDEPTRSMLETRLAKAEKGQLCVSFSTGMGAISAALGVCLKAGDHLIANETLYGCTYSLLKQWLPRFGVEVDLCSFTEVEKIEKLIKPNTRVFYTESPINPTIELIDIEGLRECANRVNKKRKKRENQIKVIVDNTFATPFGQRPLELGADIVCHSLTKSVGGFGTDMGGAVISNGELEGELLVWRKDFGAVLSSRSAWSILVYGLPTLPLRMAQQSRSATEIATWLEQQPQIERVNYPGLPSFKQRQLAIKQMKTPEGEFMPGNMIYFETVEKDEKGHAKCDQLIDYIGKNSYAITLAVSLGQLRTLIENPVSMTHSALGALGETKLKANGIRLAIGIEDPKDIIKDLNEALQTLSKG